MRIEPTMREETLRTQIAIGSITNLLILCMMFAFMITGSALADNGFRALHRDPGIRGLNMLVYMVPYYALMPIYVYWVSGLRLRFLRWVAVANAGLGFVFWILHHLSHWHFGERPDFGSHVMDLTLHAVGLWVLVQSITWAKLPLSVSVVDRVPVANNAA